MVRIPTIRKSKSSAVSQLQPRQTKNTMIHTTLPEAKRIHASCTQSSQTCITQQTQHMRWNVCILGYVDKSACKKHRTDLHALHIQSELSCNSDGTNCFRHLLHNKSCSAARPHHSHGSSSASSSIQLLQNIVPTLISSVRVAIVS